MEDDQLADKWAAVLQDWAKLREPADSSSVGGKKSAGADGKGAKQNTGDTQSAGAKQNRDEPWNAVERPIIGRAESPSSSPAPMPWPELNTPVSMGAPVAPKRGFQFDFKTKSVESNSSQNSDKSEWRSRAPFPKAAKASSGGDDAPLGGFAAHPAYPTEAIQPAPAGGNGLWSSKDEDEKLEVGPADSTTVGAAAAYASMMNYFVGSGITDPEQLAQLMQEHWRPGMALEAASSSEPVKQPKSSEKEESKKEKKKEKEAQVDRALVEELIDDNKTFIGRIRNFNESGGWGFIDCEPAKAKYGQDVWIHRRQMFGFSPGDDVCFTITKNTAGQPQARQVTKLKDLPKLKAKKQQLLERSEHQLKLKKGGQGKGNDSDVEVMDEEEARRFQSNLRKRKRT